MSEPQALETETSSAAPARSAAAPSRAYGWGMGLFAVFAFSLATPIARGLMVGGAHPTGVVVVRLALATLLHGCTLALTNRALLRPDRRGLSIALGAGAITGIGMTLYFWALTRLDASITAMLLATSPLVVLSLLTLRGEKVTRRHLVRIGLALLGVYLLIGPGGNVDLVGVGLVLLAVLAFACQLVVVQWYLQPYDARTITFFTNFGMFLIVAVVWSGQGLPWNPVPLGGWVAIVVLAIVSTYLSRWAMYEAIHVIGSGQMSLLTPLEILLTVIWSILFLHERLTLLHWAGGALILVSALLAIKRINLARHRRHWRTWIRS